MLILNETSRVTASEQRERSNPAFLFSRLPRQGDALPRNNIKGFTLVELAIVIVIIGLIVGGVVGGSSLIESSKINSVISDINKYKTAIRAFQLEYDALPGDMRDATDYWGSISGNCNFEIGNGVETRKRKCKMLTWKNIQILYQLSL